MCLDFWMARHYYSIISGLATTFMFLAWFHFGTPLPTGAYNHFCTCVSIYFSMLHSSFEFIPKCHFATNTWVRYCDNSMGPLQNLFNVARDVDLIRLVMICYIHIFWCILIYFCCIVFQNDAMIFLQLWPIMKKSYRQRYNSPIFFYFGIIICYNDRMEKISHLSDNIGWEMPGIFAP